MSVKERLKKFAESVGLSIYAFEKELNVSNGYINSISKSIGLDKLELLIEKFPNLNIEWLLTGRGEMLRSESKQQALIPSDSNQGIPLIPIDAMAGFGSGDIRVMNYEVSRYVVPEFEELDVEFMIRVKGSSMYPKYNSGDIVACKHLSLSDIFFQWNKVYVLDTDQGALIKRVKKGSDKEHILLVSDNESYDPFEIHLDQVHAIAIVMGVIRME